MPSRVRAGGGSPAGGVPSEGPVAPRFIAGLPTGFVVDHAAWQTLEAAGAKIIAYRPRLDLLVLEIADPEAFVPPAFIAFLEPDRMMSAEEE